MNIRLWLGGRRVIEERGSRLKTHVLPEASGRTAQIGSPFELIHSRRLMNNPIVGLPGRRFRQFGNTVSQWCQIRRLSAGRTDVSR